MHRFILWFRNDLRLHDNYIIDYALKHAAKNKEIVPVFSFDDRIYDKASKTKFKTIKTGALRAQFMIESLENLKKNFREIGSDMLVTIERPEIFIPKWLSKDAENIILFQTEICSEEKYVDNKIRKNVSGLKNVEVKELWGSTIYHIDDLPYSVENLSHIYGKFREKSQSAKIRECVPTPTKGSLPFAKNLPDEI